MEVDWQTDLDRWLAPFVAALRHKTRARMCPLYVAGLIGPGDRKSVQPMAARAGDSATDQPFPGHHFKEPNWRHRWTVPTRTAHSVSKS